MVYVCKYVFNSIWWILLLLICAYIASGKKPQNYKKVDGKMAYELAVAYFCTGDPAWFEKITDSALRFFCDLLYSMICKKDLPHIETIIKWVTDLQESMGADTKYGDCMIKETKQSLRDLFCEGEESVVVLENLMKFLAKWSCDASARSWDSSLCEILKFLHRHSRRLVFGFAPLVCAITSEQHYNISKRSDGSAFEEISHISQRNESSYTEFETDVSRKFSKEQTKKRQLEKRQYDLSSMVKFLRNLVCNKDTFLRIVGSDTAFDTEALQGFPDEQTTKRQLEKRQYDLSSMVKFLRNLTVYRLKLASFKMFNVCKSLLWTFLLLIFSQFTAGETPQNDKKVDGKMAHELAVAYFCPGDPAWFEKITDPALRFFCDLLYSMICKKDLPHIETIIKWVTDLQESMGADTMYEDCIMKETEEGLNDLFCKGEESVVLLENLIKFLAKWSCDASARSWDSSFCQILTFLQRISRSLVFGFEPLVCGAWSENDISKRNESSYTTIIATEALRGFSEEQEKKRQLEKRQYDLSSMVKFLRNLVCNKDTFLQIVGYVEKKSAEDQEGMTNLASLLHGFICCTLIAIHV
ncbi:hypothetical protein ACHWQZ_G001133 [Mnemiopsis leidyi]